MPSDFREDAFRAALLYGLASLAQRSWTLTTSAGDSPAPCAVYEEGGEAGLEFGDTTLAVPSDCEVSGLTLRSEGLEYSAPLAPASLPAGAMLTVSPGRVLRIGLSRDSQGTRTANE